MLQEEMLQYDRNMDRTRATKDTGNKKISVGKPRERNALGVRPVLSHVSDEEMSTVTNIAGRPGKIMMKN